VPRFDLKLSVRDITPEGFIMAVKVDKEFLLKHRFWILTGVFAILALVPLFLLTTSVSAFVATKQKEFDDAKKSIDSINGQSPNQKWVDDYQKQDNYVADKKGQVHQEAWKSQADMMTYPDAMVPVMKDKRFGEPLGFLDLDKFARVYDSQLRDVVAEVQPLLPFQEGFQDGIVQFANNNIEGVLRLKVDFKDLPPTKEDFWLSEEDVWVTRELLRIIRDANDLVARFRPVDEIEAAAAEKKAAESAKAAEAAKAANEGNPAEVKTPEGTAPAAKPAPKVVKKPVDLNHRSFRNQHWQLDLSLTPGKDDKNRPKITLAGSIKNVGSRKRALGIQFKVYLQEGPNASGVLLNVDREPLAVGESWTFPSQDYSPEKIAFQGLFGVEEVLTWRTAPVKRIDVIELGYESSRMANRTLKPPRWYTPPVVVEADPSAAGGEGGAGLGGPGKFASMGMAMPGGGGGAQSNSTTKNGLQLNRYIDSNDQVRHMPVGMVVVADDEHLSELLSAFTNSRLRIQVTQCHWQVFRDKIAPASEETSPGSVGPAMGKGGAGGASPGVTMGGARGSRGRRGEEENRGATMGNNMYRGGKLGSMGGGPMLGSMGGGMKLPPGLGNKLGMGGGLSMGGAGMPGGGSQFGASDGEAEENLNLLEVAIYGVASIYEKYPPKPITPPDATADAAAGQPKP
jgi:hypothetical protein